jgi:hypothetical protein
MLLEILDFSPHSAEIPQTIPYRMEYLPTICNTLPTTVWNTKKSWYHPNYHNNDRLERYDNSLKL